MTQIHQTYSLNLYFEMSENRIQLGSLENKEGVFSYLDILLNSYLEIWGMKR